MVSVGFPYLGRCLFLSPGTVRHRPNTREQTYGYVPTKNLKLLKVGAIAMLSGKSFHMSITRHCYSRNRHLMLLIDMYIPSIRMFSLGTNPGTDCNEVKQFCDENPSPCSNQSIYCNNTFGGYECTCEKYWRGRHCDEPPYCLSSPCSETGVCNDTDDGYVCTCQEGWQGRHCSEKITPCTSLPCLNNGICTVVDGAYNCTCVGVWEGPECQNEIKEIFYGRCI